MINWECRQCQEPMEAPESLQGEPLDCPHCGTSQRVPYAHRDSGPARDDQGANDLDDYDKQIGDYKLRVDGQILRIDGPDDSVGKAIGPDYLAALRREEMFAVVLTGESEEILGEALGGFHRGLKGHATKRQLQYADTLGLTYPENPTKAYIGRMLDQFEEVRFYVCFIWRSMMDEAPSDSGVPKGMIDRFVVDLLRSEESLWIGALLARSLANHKGMSPPTDTALFREIAGRLKTAIMPSIRR